MMKKAFVIAAAVLLIVSLSSCSGGSSGPVSSGGEESPSGSQPASIGDPSQPEASAQPEIPAQNGDVSINLPGDFFESDPDFDPSAYAQKQGFIGAAVNEDGSVTVTMTKERQQELLTDLREEIENAFEELAGGSATPYVTNITCDENFTQIVMEVEREAYEAAADMTPVTLGFSAMLYQKFSGQEPHCNITVKDAATGEAITNAVYPGALGR